MDEAVIGDSRKILLFCVDEVRCALDIESVEQVLQAVELSSLPGAPVGVPGIISVQGAGTPVFDIRSRFGIPSRAMRLDDRLVVAMAGDLRVALWVDEAGEVIDLPRGTVQTATAIPPNLPEVRGVVSTSDGLVLIYDLSEFLSVDQRQTLDAAVQKRSAK
jgi:purine-binding chemotaxis protein CheW